MATSENMVQEAESKAGKAADKKTVSMPFGVPGYTLKDEPREVPTTEPPVWPTNKDLKYVGQPVERWDGAAKVTGRARYTADVQLPGMLYAKFANASVPHAKVVSIDTSAAEKYSGVKAVYVIQHIDGGAVLRDPSLEQVKYPVVRYAGQPVAAVAATTPNAAEEGAALIKIQYEPMPFAVDLDKARAPDAALVFPGAADQAGTAGGGGGPHNVPQTGNVHGPSIHKKGGDIDQGFKDADVVVEGHYITQVQTHSALETHGVVADWKPEMLTVWASTQGTASVREELSQFFKLPMSQVRVITEYMGGGFGAKFGAGNFGIAAATLSKKAGAPVRLMLDREEEHLSVGNRPSSDQVLRIGAKKSGEITAIHLVSYGTAGCGTGAGCAGPAQNLYKYASLHTEENDVFINAGPGTAMRAPGHPPGAFALEGTIDDLAEKLGMDPIDLRDKADEHPVRRVERQIVRESDLWKSRNPKAGAGTGPVKHGVGLAQSVWYRFVNMNSAAEVRVHKDGSLEVLSAVQDIGSGIKTVLAQILAEQFGVPPAQVAVKVGDTNYPPGPNSGGSVTTLSLTPAVRDAAWQASQKFLTDVAPALGTTPNDLVLVNGEVRSKSGKMQPVSFRRAAAKMTTDQIAVQAKRVPDYDRSKYLTYGGVDVAEVMVDTETGRIQVKRVLSVHDCGRPMNPSLVKSQINGGVIQGISYTLFENRLLDPVYGLMVNPNLDMYKIAGSRETPQIDVHLVEAYIGQSSTDASGIGEAAGIVSVGAAIGNAVYNALGVRIRQMPMTPSVVLAALRRPAPERNLA
ncbi:xanthine dehydrogenase family protein molybdopterin-binding subunit [Alloacidobacterium sp.]|uniref:xanthine dehydrogenase family protein molybdopterin-binding subunit n=1 Tax=Alloacidobacterium sp. TaxID=2951999 RepID=UPI002D75A6B3|nr:xanthine dehydrogenase family protein molybdopterin-binding subunit [Alloacidobacterium sp.]HYK37869.1 xanthine dehydrogenase family protein molybdopterin-binding subunit [Alloacidobacterium sp.]